MANFGIFLDVFGFLRFRWIFPFFRKIGFLGILDPPYYGICATIHIGWEMLCLPYAGFFLANMLSVARRRLRAWDLTSSTWASLSLSYRRRMWYPPPLMIGPSIQETSWSISLIVVAFLWYLKGSAQAGQPPQESQLGKGTGNNIWFKNCAKNLFNRPGVGGAVLSTCSWLNNYLINLLSDP